MLVVPREAIGLVGLSDSRSCRRGVYTTCFLVFYGALAINSVTRAFLASPQAGAVNTIHVGTLQ